MKRLTKTKISIVGLGFVGAPLAVAIASKKHNSLLYNVVGIEKNNKQGIDLVKNFNNGKFKFDMADIYLKKLLKKYTKKNLFATTDLDQIKNTNIVIITISCNLVNEKHFKKDFNSFINNLKFIFEKISQNTLIILESTVPPGTCENYIYPSLLRILKKRKVDHKKVYFAYSYERVMPGSDYLKSITNYWRVYSGINSISKKKCKKFYETLIDIKNYPLTELETIKEAELSKVLENSYRAVNIAFIEEWRKYSRTMNIDLKYVIDAIRKRPTHKNIMSPGYGVGGYCLTKDPLFGSYSSKLFHRKKSIFKMSQMALQINKEMPNDLNKIIKNNISKKTDKILIVGASYKKNVGDTRYSASKVVFDHTKKLSKYIDFYDPYVQYWPECKLHSIKDLNIKLYYDLIIFLVDHDKLKKIKKFNFKSKTKIIEVGNIINSNVRNKIKKNKNQIYINY